MDTIDIVDLENLCAVGIELEELGYINSAIKVHKIGLALGDATCATRLADIFSENAQFLDIPLARKIYTETCIKGHAPACRNLAILLRQLGDETGYSKFMKAARDRGDVWQVDG